MRRARPVATLSLVAAVGWLAACSSAPPDPDLAAQLEQDTGVPWTVYRDPDSHEVRFLAPERPVAIGTGTPEAKARAFFDRYRAALHGSGKPDELELVSTATDARGGIHIRFEHTLPGTGLRVFHTGTTAHFTADGSVYWMAPDFRAGIADVDASATVTKEQASAAAVDHVKTACGAHRGDPVARDPELGALTSLQGETALVYRVAVSGESARCIAPAVFVDAKSGAVVQVDETAHRRLSPEVAGSRFYRALDGGNDKKAIDVLDSSVDGPARYSMVSTDAQGSRIWTHPFDSDAPLTTGDIKEWEATAAVRGSGVDAHFFSARAIAFLRPFSARFESHKRFGTPPLSTDVHVYVHDNSKRNSLGMNAYAVVDPIKGDTLHFGDGEYPQVQNALPMSAAYDVVAHEMAHLVIAHTSELVNAYEPGALNESFADVMGAAAERQVAENDANNFLIGEGLYFKGPPGNVALRSMRAPRSFGAPDHIEDKVKCQIGESPTNDNDMCKVHENAGIPNRAFSLMVGGGAIYKQERGKAPELRPIGVPQGIGWGAAVEVTYWATIGLQPTAGFGVAALAQVVESANVNIGISQTVACAWLAVGVYEPRTPIEALVLATVCKPPAQQAPSNPAPPPSNVAPSNLCSGHGDSLVCDPVVPNQAIVCKNGAPTIPPATFFCADLAQVCKKTSSGDPTAVTEAGVIVCE